MSAPLDKKLQQYGEELGQELELILRYWNDHIVSPSGSFYGSLNNRNIPDRNAPIGIVMVSRILWTFSSAALEGKLGYDGMLSKAYSLITNEFTDVEYGGVYWSINRNGAVEDKKQIYGLAFCIYGLAEYYKVTGEEQILKQAIELYRFIEEYGSDKTQGGYIEALARDWKELDDLRLSEKDMNTKKSMNTHLHVVEAYANLYSVWNDAGLKEKISGLLKIFHERIIDSTTGHMHLFMDADWEVQSNRWSFGHDIEAAWLLLECAELISSGKWRERFTEHAFRLANAASRGLDDDGGMFYEYDTIENTFLKEKHWWPQAEAMIGFFKLWRLSGDVSWLEKSISSWHFVKTHLKDIDGGEWYWGVDESGALMENEKAGFWKCPYHNGRACMEIVQDLESTIRSRINVTQGR